MPLIALRTEVLSAISPPHHTITADMACFWLIFSIRTIRSDYLDCADPNNEIGSSAAVRPEARPELHGH